MTGHDDADPDDDGLKSLRAVWLSLPDEDPPERGFADLMAAARVKADEMAAQPSWWDRFVALMRRPQVLALATIVLLIGGGVIISQKQEQLEAPATETQPATVDRASDMEHDKDSRESGAPGSAAIAAPALQVEAPAAEPAPALDEMRAKGSTGRATKEPPPPPRVAKPKAVTTQPKKAGLKADTGSMGGDMAEVQDSTVLRDEGKQAVESTVTSGATRTRGDRAEPTVKQLHTQAREAAARGDCEAVRLLAKKIARQDAPYYRASIAPDQALATCLN